MKELNRIKFLIFLVLLVITLFFIIWFWITGVLFQEIHELEENVQTLETSIQELNDTLEKPEDGEVRVIY